MSALFYDVSTIPQITILTTILQQTDITLGYLAADGVTQTPKSGIIAITGQIAPNAVGQTIRWSALDSHPTIANRKSLLVDQFISATVASGKVAGTGTLPAPTVLDSSWQKVVGVNV